MKKFASLISSSSLGSDFQDMFFLHVPVTSLPEISKFWQSQHQPPFKILTERPGHLQLFHQPIGLFLELPPSSTSQDFKQAVCNSLLQQGVEIPFPWNGGVVARRAIKVHVHMLVKALNNLGITHVHLGQFGCKTPLHFFKQDFGIALTQLMVTGAAIDLGWQGKDQKHIFLFGVKGG